jgi:hypothetical protein
MLEKQGYRVLTAGTPSSFLPAPVIATKERTR